MTGARTDAEDTMPGTSPLMQALSGFRESAQAAIAHWGGDFTVQQGLDIIWMLGNNIRDLRIAAGALGNFEVTRLPETQPDPQGSTADESGRMARSAHQDLRTPNGEISKAAQCLGAAADRALALPLPGVLVRSANPEGGTRPGGDPHGDGPAVAAAHDMRNALGVAAGTWMHLSGSDEDRDKIVTEMLFAVDRLEVATLILAQGGPAHVQVRLRQVAGDLDSSCIHLRESVICSLTGGYQPGTGDLARQLRETFPVLSEARPTSFPEVGGPGRETPSLAATAFPRSPGAATSAGRQLRAPGAAGSPSQPKQPDSQRRKL